MVLVPRVYKRTPPAERFWPRVDKTGGTEACWPWTGGRGGKYGSFALTHHTSVGAHCMAWALANGPIPNGMMVLHSCDNPPCCNPAHLFIGTHSDNMKDAAAKGRLALQQRGRIQRATGTRHHNSRLTEDNVREIRRRAADGETQREIARRFSITQPAVGYIVRREQWRHVCD